MKNSSIILLTVLTGLVLAGLILVNALEALDASDTLEVDDPSEYCKGGSPGDVVSKDSQHYYCDEAGRACLLEITGEGEVILYDYEGNEKMRSSSSIISGARVQLSRLHDLQAQLSEAGEELPTRECSREACNGDSDCYDCYEEISDSEIMVKRSGVCQSSGESNCEYKHELRACNEPDGYKDCDSGPDLDCRKECGWTIKVTVKEVSCVE
ncbi:hypothetical protein COT48_04590 [Candidatus Woesearchaeota archaeon CG08_land_8_20_14_0_20_47_9]|nr:MAG: hypothetical protein AUJ69_02735 [Candidatus Woesearchaeota archaeon CG1_02_47_18]PIO03492.1 MAG: hypothetical protein COT48_04590 [Candidatus Woesearchaeota archaeon CG08_land_8_20_14_0_20_47_9]HII29852.1 hypothetical protein [Candidatus Woesearchaeota archaeon]